MPKSSADAAQTILTLAHLHDALAQRSGRTPAQWSALRYFAALGSTGGTVTGFASAHAVTVSSASQTVDQLARRGLLSRDRLETDRRTLRVCVTPEGRAALADDPVLVVGGVIAGLGEADAAQLADRLRAVARGLIRETRKARGEDPEA